MAGAHELSESFPGDWNSCLALVPKGQWPHRVGPPGRGGELGSMGRTALPFGTSRLGRRPQMRSSSLGRRTPNGIERPASTGLGRRSAKVGRLSLSLFAHSHWTCQDNQRNATKRRVTPPSQPDRVGLAMGGHGLSLSPFPRRSRPQRHVR